MLVLRRVLFGFTALQKTAIHNASHDHPKYVLPFWNTRNLFLGPRYLNDVGTGGHTLFPTLGIKVKPSKGSASLGLRKNQWFHRATMRCRAQEHQKSESSKSMAISDLYLIYAFRKQPLSTSTAMKVLNDCPCFTDFTALEGSTPKKYPPKKQQNPTLGTRNIIFKRCLFGERKR